LILRSLATRNFRNLAEGEVAFHPAANVVVGDNGQGKTNLLEAIYFLGTTKSFRTPRTTNLVRSGESLLYVRGLAESEGIARQLSIGLAAESERRRELRINEEKVSLQKYVSTLPLFAYSSARLEIIRGAPEERRRFLDRGIAGIQPAHLTALSRYTRALQQRNALLQRASGGTDAALEAWDEEVIRAAAPIVAGRASYIAALESEFGRIISEHRYHVDSLAMRYQPAGFDISGEPDREMIRSLRRREREAGFTMWGPHRDGLSFEIAGRAAHDILSSGEIKMMVLFLKFAKIAVYRRSEGDPPLFLLDDVDAELDLGIIERLLRFLAGSLQLFTTTAKEPVIRALPLAEHRLISMKQGIVTVEGDRG
jgi:DNA replication and repair protein RecF